MRELKSSLTGLMIAFFSFFLLQSAIDLHVGKCIPITRGAGIYQPHMAEALERLNEGEWVICLIFLP